MDFQGNQNLIENKEEKLLEPGIIAHPVVLQPPAPKEDEIILEVRNLTVSFGDEVVLDNLSFNLKKGGECRHNGAERRRQNGFA